MSIIRNLFERAWARSTGRSLIAGFAVLGLLSAAPSTTHADDAYGFSLQGISNLRLTPSTGLTLTQGTVKISSSDNASVGGTSDANQGTTDTVQAYVGTPTAPSENFYGTNIAAGGSVPARGVSASPVYSWLSAGGSTGANGSAFANFATASFPLTGSNADNGLPAGTMPISVTTGALGDFARGDLLVTGTLSDLFTNGISGINVAESYLSGTGASSSQANATWVVTANFVASGSGTLGVNADYTNSLYSAAVGANATASSDYKVDYTLTNLTTSSQPDQHFSPIALNHTHTSPTNQDEHVHNGLVDSPSFTLLTGDTYQLQMSFSEHTILAVPEPSSLITLGMGLSLGLAGFYRRARRQA